MTGPAAPTTLLLLADGPGLLTPRQREVLELARAQLSNAEIATRLGLSVHTVRSHLNAAVQRLAGQRRRAGRRAGGRPLTRSESALLVAILQSPLVGELARQMQMKPKACRRLLESIVEKVARIDSAATPATPPARSSTPKTSEPVTVGGPA